MTKKIVTPEFSSEKANRGMGGKRGGRSAKASGTYFENQATDYFNTGVSHAKRILGSGAFGKVSRDPTLLGDVCIEYEILKHPLLIDCKFGYGGQSQLTLKKEWLDKIATEAALTDKYPAVMGKFKGARGGNSRFIVLTWETWQAIMSELTEHIKFLEGLPIP